MQRKWWHTKTAYQIYPKSFCDSNGDGIGDLRGIISRLDYLKDLGVDIIWISPCYPSPLADEGYDISDYYNIDPRFGTLDDMDELIREAKKRDMYIVLDLVVNHCSDEHEWFRKACEDPDGKYGKYFFIRNRTEDDRIPTNWRSYFGGTCWEPLPGHPDRLYLHVFHKKQPDLNWENPELREEVYRNINWWLDRGVAGFRIDAIINIKKAFPFRDYPVDRPDGLSSIENMLKEARGILTFLDEMRDRCFAAHDTFSVGEVFNEKDEELPFFIGDEGCFSSMFDFREAVFGASIRGAWDRTEPTPEDYKNCVFAAQERIGETGFLSNIIENHDEPRGVSRYIPKEELSLHAKKLLAMEYFCLRGLPFIYEGQEIGMENITAGSIDEIDDCSAMGEYQTALSYGLTEEKALESVQMYSRDNARTPVQWDTSPNAGFTSGTPWIRVNPDYREINVAAEKNDPDSLLSFYKELIRIRKDPEYIEAIVYGRLIPYKKDVRNLMAYTRESIDGKKKLMVIGNFQKEARDVELPSEVKKVLLNNYPDFKICGRKLHLEDYQAVLLEI